MPANFQPQVGNTSHGPAMMYYCPRHDPPGWRMVCPHPTPVPYPVYQPPVYGCGGGVNNTVIVKVENQNFGGGPCMGHHIVHPPMVLPPPPPPVVYPACGNRGILMPPGPYGFPPVLWGNTRSEQFRHDINRADRTPQPMVPADSDPAKTYLVQELDGNWTRRNRFTIDSGDIGEVQWFPRADGTWFAKRKHMG